jgi:hypothetical protein
MPNWKIEEGMRKHENKSYEYMLWGREADLTDPGFWPTMDFGISSGLFYAS